MVGNRCNEPAAKDADALFLAELPGLSELRNWWVHPPDPGQLGWVTWFQQDVARLLPNGAVEYLVDAEAAQRVAEGLYETLCSILGDLPRAEAARTDD